MSVFMLAAGLNAAQDPCSGPAPSVIPSTQKACLEYSVAGDSIWIVIVKAVITLTRRLASQAVESGVPLALCGHRPVLPLMLEALGIPARSLQPGSAIVAHLDPSGKVLAVELHKPRI